MIGVYINHRRVVGGGDVGVVVGADVGDNAAHAVEHVGERARHEVTRLTDHLVWWGCSIRVRLG